MDIKRLNEILHMTTVQLRKGNIVEVEGNVTSAYLMFYESSVDESFEKIDVHFVVIGVKKETAIQVKDELISILKGYPDLERLAGGPSYMEVGAELGTQAAAFELFALGKYLGLWDIITPERIGVTGAKSDEMAGSGFVMISGFTA